MEVIPAEEAECPSTMEGTRHDVSGAAKGEEERNIDAGGSGNSRERHAHTLAEGRPVRSPLQLRSPCSDGTGGGGGAGGGAGRSTPTAVERTPVAGGCPTPQRDAATGGADTWGAPVVSPCSDGRRRSACRQSPLRRGSGDGLREGFLLGLEGRTHTNSPPLLGSWLDTHEAVYKPWLSMEVAIPQNEATHCWLSSKCKIISRLRAEPS